MAKLKFLSIPIFLLFIVLPIIGHNFSSDDISTIELRNPAPLPSVPLNFEELKKLPAKIDSYLNDHFGFRSVLIDLNCRLKDLLKVSGSPEVILGKEGWLFLKRNHNVLDQFRGLDNFSPTELSRWFAMMEARRHWLAQRNIQFVVAIVPNKHTIYPEYLPSYLNKVGKTRREQIMESAPRYPSLSIIDLTPVLLKEKTNYRLFYKTDTHWNDIGQLLGYKALMDHLSVWFPGIRPLRIDQFELTKKEAVGGDLTQLLNSNPNYRNDEPSLHARFPSKVSSSRMYEGRYRKIRLSRSTNIGQPVVLIFGDSFILNWRSVLYQETFHKTVATHHMGQQFDKQIVEQFEPQIVIFQIAERLLDRYPRQPFNVLK